jgi:glycerol uptake facilitator-like aquaporin
MQTEFGRRLLAEGLGTAFLVATVVGSGIMAQSLTSDVALALLANSLATGAVLVVLIAVLGPVSGAHFNPAVSLVFAIRGEMSAAQALLYAAAQFAGAIAGTVVAQLMFALPAIELSANMRSGSGLWLGEAVATFGLVLIILGAVRTARQAIPWLVGLYITAAYWFTSSTSFANPAVTLARSLSNTFAGIAPASVPAFVLCQIVGALMALLVARVLFAKERDVAA